MTTKISHNTQSPVVHIAPHRLCLKTTDTKIRGEQHQPKHFQNNFSWPALGLNVYLERIYYDRHRTWIRTYRRSAYFSMPTNIQNTLSLLWQQTYRRPYLCYSSKHTEDIIFAMVTNIQKTLFCYDNKHTEDLIFAMTTNTWKTF
jgi:hypothetical protein